MLNSEIDVNGGKHAISVRLIKNYFKNSVIHERNTKQISTIIVTVYLIKLIDVRKNTNEHRILYKISS